MYCVSEKYKTKLYEFNEYNKNNGPFRRKCVDANSLSASEGNKRHAVLCC